MTRPGLFIAATLHRPRPSPIRVIEAAPVTHWLRPVASCRRDRPSPRSPSQVLGIAPRRRRGRGLGGMTRPLPASGRRDRGAAWHTEAGSARPRRNSECQRSPVGDISAAPNRATPTDSGPAKGRRATSARQPTARTQISPGPHAWPIECASVRSVDSSPIEPSEPTRRREPGGVAVSRRSVAPEKSEKIFSSASRCASTPHAMPRQPEGRQAAHRRPTQSAPVDDVTCPHGQRPFAPSDCASCRLAVPVCKKMLTQG